MLINQTFGITDSKKNDIKYFLLKKSSKIDFITFIAKNVFILKKENMDNTKNNNILYTTSIYSDCMASCQI